MKIQCFLFLSILIFFSCKKDDDSGIQINNLEIFGNEYFKTYDGYFLSSEDSELTSDENIIIVGNGNVESNILVEPFFLKTGVNAEFVDINFTDPNISPSRYWRMDLLPLQNGEYAYLSSRPENSSNETDIIFRKLKNNGETIWEKTIGENSISERGASVIQLPDNDFIILGTVTQGTNFPDQLLLSRVSEQGEILWTKKIIDIILTGISKLIYESNSNSIFVLTNHDLLVNETGEIRITKFDIEGNFTSSNLFESSTNTYPFSSGMKLMTDGSILVYFSSTNELTGGNNKVRIFNLNPNLEEQWSIIFEDIKDNFVSDILELPNDEFIILSKSTSVGNGGLDVILSKIDMDGNSIWNKVYGSASSDQGSKLHQKANNDLIIVGNSNHNTGSDMIFDTFVLTTDMEGNPK